jgi:hypothetical protein
MNIAINGQQLEFIHIPIVLHKQGIVDLFALKNNKSLAETLSSKRYSGFSKEIILRYPHSLDKKLGEFLLELKNIGDLFYLQFLNKYGDSVFCDFSIASTPITKLKGIYSFAIGSEIKYFGRSHDPFEKRLNQGYGHLSQKNCFRDGQSTNCRINSLIAKKHKDVSFYLYPIDDDIEIDRLEKLLIDWYKPDWNIQR